MEREPLPVAGSGHARRRNFSALIACRLDGAVSLGLIAALIACRLNGAVPCLSLIAAVSALSSVASLDRSLELGLIAISSGRKALIPDDAAVWTRCSAVRSRSPRSLPACLHVHAIIPSD